jgi:hypothetical protein
LKKKVVHFNCSGDTNIFEDLTALTVDLIQVQVVAKVEKDLMSDCCLVPKDLMSDCCLVPIQQFFKLYLGEGKLISNEMMMRSSLY